MPDLNGKLPRSHVLARQRAAPIPEPRATPRAPDDAEPEELFAAGKAQYAQPEPPEDLNSDSQGDDSPGDDPAPQEAPEFGSATTRTSHGDSNIESGQAGEGGEIRWENLPPVDGQQLMADLEAFVGQYLAFPSRHCLVAVCLWIVHTWALFAFYVTPRLIFDSPEPSCGKTRVLEVLALLCRGGKVTMSTTVAALYRRIAQAGDRPPTILQDEADVVFGKTTTLQAEDLRALFNAGYKRGATVDRCEGDPRNMRVVDFPVFAPVALAGLLGKMPATITTRAITIHMRRRAPEDAVRPYRERIAALEATPLRERIETWAEQNITTLADAWPQMPEGVEDRPAEVWEALLAIADAVGGDWPDRARAACRYFVLDSDSDDKLSLGLRLLRDIKDVFGGQDRMFSLHLVSGLIANPEWEWSDLWGKSLDQRRVAKELKRYGVESDDIRIGDAVRKGYTVDGDNGLGQAWARYLSPTSRRNERDKGDIAGQGVAECGAQNHERDKRDTNATAELPLDHELFENVADVADGDDEWSALRAKLLPYLR